MIIFLYGPNSYLRHKKYQEIITEYQKRLGKLFLERFDFANDEYGKFESFAEERSMFDAKKFAVLENIFETGDKKALKKTLEANLDDKETMIIILSDAKPPQSFAFLLEKPVVSQHFPDIKKGEELNVFVSSEARVRGLNLDKSDVLAISETFGADIFGIVTELDKISMMGEKTIERKTSADYFKLIMALKLGKNVKDKIIALEKILSERGDEPAKVFNTIAYGYTKPELIDALADYDVMVKSGKLDYEEALLDLALKN